MMDVDKLKDYALFIKNTFVSGKKNELEIFYHEQNHIRLLSQQDVDSSFNLIYTPVYATAERDGLSFRGFIEKCDIDHLTIGLECLFKRDSLDTIVDWSVSCYNTAKDECLLLGDSKIDLSSGDPMCRSEVKVAVSFLETYILGNPLVFKWSVETLLPQSRDTEDINEVHSGNYDTSLDVGLLMLSRDTEDPQEADTDIGSSIDALMQHLSSQVFKEDDQNKQELHSVIKEILTCQSKQHENEGHLQTIEQQCLNINERLGQLLERMDLQEIGVTRPIANYSIRSSNLLSTGSKGKIQFSDQKVSSPQFYRTLKLQAPKTVKILHGRDFSRTGIKADDGKQSKTCQTETETVGGCSFPVNKIIQLNQTTQTDFEPLASKISTSSKLHEMEDECLLQQSSFYRPYYASIDPRIVEACKNRRVLFLGTELWQMKIFVRLLFNKDVSALEPERLFKVVCEKEEMELYVGYIGGKPTSDGLLNLMANSYNFKSNEFHGCIYVSSYEIHDICDIFEKWFLMQYCITIIDKESRNVSRLKYSSLESVTFHFTDLTRPELYSYSYSALKRAIDLLTEQSFTFDETILKPHLKELLLSEKASIEMLDKKSKQSSLEKKTVHPIKVADSKKIHRSSVSVSQQATGGAEIQNLLLSKRANREMLDIKTKLSSLEKKTVHPIKVDDSKKIHRSSVSVSQKATSGADIQKSILSLIATREMLDTKTKPSSLEKKTVHSIKVDDSKKIHSDSVRPKATSGAENQEAKQCLIL